MELKTVASKAVRKVVLSVAHLEEEKVGYLARWLVKKLVEMKAKNSDALRETHLVEKLDGSWADSKAVMKE